MTQAEQALLIAYLVDAGELVPRAIWRSSSWTGARSAGKRSPERHITRASQGRPKGVLDAARIKARSFEDGRRAGLAEGAAKLGWDRLASSPGFHRFTDHVHRAED